MRELLVEDVRQRNPGCRTTEAGSLQDLRQLDPAELATVDLAIVDLELPDGNSLDWVEAYAHRPQSPRILLVSSIDEDFVLYRALRSGASGFAHKLDGRQSLVLGIEMLLAGNMFFSPAVLRLKRSMETDPSFFSKILTDKQQQILRLIGEGLSNEEIAQIEGYKVASVVAHRKNIMGKLDIHTAPELMRYALQKGFARI